MVAIFHTLLLFQMQVHLMHLLHPINNVLIQYLLSVSPILHIIYFMCFLRGLS